MIYPFKSILYAWRGFKYAILHEKNVRIQVLAAIFVFCAALFFHVSVLEAMVLVLVTSMVLILELINSALEKLTDIVKPRLHEQVETVKDMMAGAVLMSALTAAVIGITIFLPYLIEFVKRVWYTMPV